VKIDALAFEPQFLDHLAPVWGALGSHRGTFFVDPSLAVRARALGVEAVPTPRPPHTVPQPVSVTDQRPALVASYGDVKEARRLGFGPLVFLEHGIGQSYQVRPGPGHASYAGGRDRSDNALILTPNEACAARWRASYPDAQVEVVGCPKLDYLPGREFTDAAYDPVVAFSFHWPAPLSISGYAGTAIGEYFPALAALKERWSLLGHAHPKGDWPDRVERMCAREGIRFVRDFTDVCRLADVYVCDNSSTLYEFAATGRPVVVLNAKAWSRKGQHGLRFWEAAEVGINVDDPVNLEASIALALVDPPNRQAAREAALDIVYGVRHGGAARAADIIVDWLAAR
jgi:hypothetical protein